jgi:threonine aldolase
MIKKSIVKVRPKSAHNEIFVKSNAHICRYEKRVHELFSAGHDIVLIHGLKASILKCVRLALNMCEYYSDVTYKIKTSS